MTSESRIRIPWFGARSLARQLAVEVERLENECIQLRKTLETVGALSIAELEQRKGTLHEELASVPFNFDIHARFFSKDAVGGCHARTIGSPSRELG